MIKVQSIQISKYSKVPNFFSNSSRNLEQKAKAKAKSKSNYHAIN